MAWEVVGGSLAAALGAGGFLGALVSRQQTVSQARYTAVQAAETVNTMLIKQIQRLDKALTDAEKDYENAKVQWEESKRQVARMSQELELEKQNCAHQLNQQSRRIDRLELALKGKQDVTDHPDV